jgi:hypothetical protein
MEYTDKLERISEFIANREKEKNKITTTEMGNSYLINLDRSSKKLLKQNISKFESRVKAGEISDDLLINYSVDKKKLSALRLYVNFAWGVVLLRYIDILIRVKHGGLYYYTGAILSYYYINKYFTNFELIRLSEVLEGQKINTVLRALKECDSKVKREENITKINLNKYWKEPMAWH